MRRLTALAFVMSLLTGYAAAQGGRHNAPPHGSPPHDSPFGPAVDVRDRMDQLQLLLLQTKSPEPDHKKTAPGVVSVLDARAPKKAKKEFERATRAYKKKQLAKAAEHYRKAIAIYPQFVAAHNDLGLIYLEQGNQAGAKEQFQAAVAQDPRMAAPYLNLGRVSLLLHDYATAEAAMKSARSIDPLNPAVLTLLAFAEFRNKEYGNTLATVRLLHSVPHKEFAVGHIAAAGALLAEAQPDGAEAEYRIFLQEEPNGAAAAGAQQAVTQIEESRARKERQPVDPPEQIEDGALVLDAPALLSAAGPACNDCATDNLLASAAAPPAPLATERRGYVFKTDVDEVRVLFTADYRGQPVAGLTKDDLNISDNGRPPGQVVDFRNEADLPLRIGLLVDTSNSLYERFEFEKKAAAQFLSSVMTGQSDVGFASGFANHLRITQDFTGDVERLAEGISRLRLGGGTSVWDAVYLGCRKLAANAGSAPVARVLVVMTDGDDNNSRVTTDQAIEAAERAGVAVYVVSTNLLAQKSRADRELQRLALQTGGDALFPGGLSDLDRAFVKLRDTLRSRYAIAYRPAAFVADGRYRSIAISAHHDGKKLNVHARKGYYATNN